LLNLILLLLVILLLLLVLSKGLVFRRNKTKISVIMMLNSLYRLWLNKFRNIFLINLHLMFYQLLHNVILRSLSTQWVAKFNLLFLIIIHNFFLNYFNYLFNSSLISWRLFNSLLLLFFKLFIKSWYFYLFLSIHYFIFLWFLFLFWRSLNLLFSLF
jgi:hypothetical protein